MLVPMFRRRMAAKEGNEENLNESPPATPGGLNSLSFLTSYARGPETADWESGSAIVFIRTH